MCTTISGVFSLLLNDSFLVVLVVCTILFILQLKFGIKIFSVNDKGKFDSSHLFKESTTHCIDKNCVRCTKYSAIINTAASKIQTLDDSTVTKRISLSLKNKIPVDTESEQEQNPNVFLYNNLTGKTLWNKNDLTEEIKQDINKLEQSWKIISKDFKRLYNEKYINHWKRNSTETGSWDVFHVVNQGMLVEDNIKLCPQTADVVFEMTTAMMNNVFGNILFSVVKSSTEISPHYGPTNIRLRCHLGLVTCRKCILHVGPDQSTWVSGQCVAFDDSFLHSVKHSGSQCTGSQPSEHLMDCNIGGSLLEEGDRAVLIVDIWHPDISIQEQKILNCLFSPVQ